MQDSNLRTPQHREERFDFSTKQLLFNPCFRQKIKIVGEYDHVQGKIIALGKLKQQYPGAGLQTVAGLLSTRGCG